ncbi:MAG: tRNA (adenosine(37)-N6)-dimethylallyltransferase MiaA [Lachnospiraceae bacterium]|jgi:tRNA dimethylallyltransferase|nr:tRNA (adenosine(37)-N6)-dimethylallyltransferase MiaA [Lachnospiraceae bacterium]
MVIIAGPTAVGKTALSLELAARIGGEIVAADSMQAYRHMDIGTAKIKPAEMRGIPHHLLDVALPTEEYNVAVFQKLAKACVNDIAGRGCVPIVVGGTGFYIQALLYDIDFATNDGDDSYRRELEEKDSPVLWRMLEECDAEAAAQIHAHNKKRIIRALEFYHQMGVPISGHNEAERQRPSPYSFAYFVLTDERAKIYAQIERRVDVMMAAGLEAEVQGLVEMGVKRDSIAMQGLGYKEMLAYLDGETSLEEAVALIKRNTRHFAKRQLTWFRRERDTIWLDKGKFANDREICDEIIRILHEKSIAQ